MQCLAKRGFLHVDFLKNSERAKSDLIAAYPNSSSRSQFCGTVLLYFSALTDEEFQKEYSGLSRGDAVETIRAVAAKANRDLNKKVNLSTNAPERT
jgi:hypothetical protein